MRCWTADVDEIHERVFVQPRDCIWIIHFKLSQTHDISSLSHYLYSWAQTLKHQQALNIQGGKKEGEGEGEGKRHWAALGVKRQADWSRLRNEPSSQSDWQVIWIAESCLPGCIKKKERKEKRRNNQRGFVAQTSLPRPEMETEALTCVSMMRRFDLRDSAPPTLLWQGSDNGLKWTKNTHKLIYKHTHTYRPNMQCLVY